MLPTYYEFFAGGGMARAGLGAGWRCVFANDWDPKKARAYRANWGEAELRVGDVAALSPADLPGTADLAWASFPCQDLSLAGGGAGLRGERSGTFRPFWRLMERLVEAGRAPRIIALENVCGALTSHAGKDFAVIGEGFARAGYRFGALVADAALWVPQSRPRLFVIGARAEISPPAETVAAGPAAPWHPLSLRTARERLSAAARGRWIWWNPPLPPPRRASLADLLEDDAAVDAAAWFSAAETRRLEAMMSARHREKLRAAQRGGGRVVGTLYRRTRRDERGVKRQRAEARLDGLAGCLRTPAGGSSRQVVIIVEGRSVRARLITARETARLMGLPEGYQLPANYNEAYHLTGDGVVVPAVAHLGDVLLGVLAMEKRTKAATA